MKAQMKISRRKFIAAAVLLMTALAGTLLYAAYVLLQRWPIASAPAA